MAAAFEFAREAFRAAQSDQQGSDLIPALLRLSDIHKRSGRYSEAIDAANQVMERDALPDQLAHALTNQGICAAETSDLARAEDLLNRAASLSRAGGSLSGLARALHHLSTAVYMARGQFDLALSCMTQATQINLEIGEPSWGLPFLKGFIYVTVGDRTRARLALDELMQFVTPSSRIAGMYYLLWAHLSMQEDDLARAREYLNLAMQVATRLGNIDLTIWTRFAHCEYARLQNTPSVALNWAEDALGVARRAGSLMFTAQALIERGQAAYLAGDPAGALDDLLQAQRATASLGCAYHQARACLLLSAIYHHQGLPEAEENWLKTVTLIKRGGYGFVLERERALAFPLVAGFLRSRSKEARAAADDMLEHLERVAPLPLRMVGLGQFTVWQGRRPIPDGVWSKRKAGELFRFLLLQPHHSSPRDVVLDNLWAEHTPTTAQDLFHQATSALRHILEPDLPDKFTSRYLTVESERVSLYLPPGSAVDFDQFSQQVPLAIRAGNMEQLLRALALYPGDLFPADTYADWAAGPREYLLQIYLNGLLALAEGYLRSSQYLQALDACQRALQRNAWNEDAVMLAIKACLGLRDAPRAVRLYMELEKTLHTELQIAPRQDLRELVKTIRQQK